MTLFKSGAYWLFSQQQNYLNNWTNLAFLFLLPKLPLGVREDRGLAQPGGEQSEKLLSVKAEHQGVRMQAAAERGTLSPAPHTDSAENAPQSAPNRTVFCPQSAVRLGADFLSFSCWTITDVQGWAFMANRNLHKHPSAQAHTHTYTVLSSPFCTVILEAPTLGKVGFITWLFQRNLTFSIVPTSSSASNSAEWVEPGLKIPLETEK